MIGDEAGERDAVMTWVSKDHPKEICPRCHGQPLAGFWQDFGRQVAMFTLRTLWMQTGESFGTGLGGCGCSRVDVKR